jgi:opacity protein-like surface antigen
MPLLANGGSLYSRYGIGDLRSAFSTRRMAMGGLGIAMSDQQYLSDINPASWNNLRLSRMEMGFLYNGDKMESQNTSAYHSNVFFNGIMFGFPLEHDLGISLVFGLIPYSNIEYDVKEEVIDTIVENHKNEYKGNGGISKFVIGGSYRLPMGLSLGLSYDYYYGRVENTSVIVFDDNSDFSNAAFNRQTTYNGMGFTAGLISNDLNEYIGLSNIKNLKIGITYSSVVSMNTDSLMNLVTTAGTITDTSKSYETELPYRLGLGISFNWTDNFIFNLDYMYQPFSKFTEDGRTNRYMQDYSKYSFGFEYRNASARSSSFWDYIALRAGVSYEQSQYIVRGTGLNQFSLYTGFSIPISYDNTLDIGFQYGSRGTTDNSLMKENFFKVNISASLGDIWFMRVER